MALNLGDLDGTNGFRLDGVTGYGYSGAAVAVAGDVNGDGFDDLIVGAPQAVVDGYYAGSSYVVFGAVAGFAPSIDLAPLDGANGFRLEGINGFDLAGYSVAGAGDVNGDGLDDLIVGAPGVDPGGKTFTGASYVVFGSSEDFAPSLDVASLNGANGFRLDGIEAYDGVGHSVAGAGDVNGDGFDDLIVGSPTARSDGLISAGATYVVFGAPRDFSSSLDLSSLDGANGFRLDGVATRDQSGWSVESAGDVNGDSIGDLIVGAPGAAVNGNAAAGVSYVVFGSTAGFEASLDFADLDGTNGFRLDGIAADDQSGWSVAGAGDVNGDGVDDFIIGAFAADPGGNSYAGQSYVVFGSTVDFEPALNLGALDGTNGFRLDGGNAYDQAGVSVAGAGDFNGDGIDDLIVGASGADPGGVSMAGETYVVFGSAAGFGPSFDLSTLDDTNSFRLEGIDAYDQIGLSIGGGGDVNGDGFDDLILGGQFGDPNGNENAGESYVVFGLSIFGPQTPILGGPGRDVLAGTDASESFHPGGGFDFVTTGGGTDTVFFDDLAGQRDVLTIADFDPLADTLDLRGAAVAETLESEARTVLLLEGADRDTIVLLGLSASPLDLI